MFLNKDQIIARGLVTGHSIANYRVASYDASVSTIINMEGKTCEKDEFKLKPQGMVYVVFNEKLNLPNDVIGFAHIKTELTRRGIMAMNTGIIDPDYKGYISTLLINFGNTDCLITKGTKAIRLTFSEIEKLKDESKEPKSSNVELQDYINEIKGKTDFLEDKFLNLSIVEKEVSSSIRKSFLQIGAIFTAASLLVSVYFNFKNSQLGEVDRSVKKYEIELQTLEQRLINVQESVSKKSDYDSSISKTLQSIQEKLKEKK